MDFFAMIRGCGVLNRRYNVLRLPVFAFLTVFLAGAAARAETYITVSDVPVDVTAKNAAAARDQAIADVQRKAFERLVKRLVSNPADQARLKPGQSEIESFVQDFAVESERVSPVRYIGRYSVRFRAGRVRKYLSDSGITAINELQQVLVAPVYRTASGDLLWGQGNAWRAVWDRGGYGDGPVSLILPNGDAFDTGTLSAAAAAQGDIGAITAIIQRYHAAGIVVAVATPRVSGKGPEAGLSIDATTYDLSGPKGTQTITIDPIPGEQPDKALLRGVAAVADTLESGWREAIGSGGSTGLTSRAQTAAMEDADGRISGTTYPILLPLAGIGDWVKTRDRLAAIQGVGRITLDALTRDAAALSLVFSGDTLALQAALGADGYVLVQTGPANAAGPGTFELRLASQQPQPVAHTSAAGSPASPLPGR